MGNVSSRHLNPKQAIIAIPRILARITWYIAIAVSFGVALMIFLEVILRYLARGPTVGLETFASSAIFWAYFLGGAYGAYEDSHIKADILPALFRKRSPRAIAILKVAALFITVGVSIYVSTWAYDYLIWGITRHEIMPYFYFPMVAFQSSIFFGLILMSFYFLIQAATSVKALFWRSSNSGVSETVR